MNHSFEELERKYIQLKIKRIVMIFSSVTLVAIFSLLVSQFGITNSEKKIEDGLVFVVDDKESSKKEEKERVIEDKANDEEIIIAEDLTKNKIFKDNPKKDVIRSLDKENIDEINIVELKPNINLDDIEDVAFKREKEILQANKKKFKNKIKSDIPEPTTVAIVEPVKKEIVKKVPIKFRVKEIKDIASLRKQFISNPSYKIAIKLARIHMAGSEHQNAVEWSLKASRMDRESIEPWIIYSKAKFQLGQKDTAIKVLELLLKKKDSKEVKSLLTSYKKRSI